MIKKTLGLLVFLVSFIFSYAQQTAVYTNELAAFNTAYELYNNQQYLAAQVLFSEIKSNTTDETLESNAAYYVANAAIRLNQQNADALMEKFVVEYPTSVKRNSAYINVASYYFENGKYSHAQKWYEKVDEYSLSASEKETYYFNNGYAFFKNQRYDEAKKYFNRVSTSEKYGSQAKYYLGFIAYEGDDYQEANEQFNQVKDEDRYAKDMSYYQADMNFKLGKFQEAIDLGLEQYERSSPREKSELSKIIGESYFNLEQYQEAIPFLKEYKGIRGKWNNTDYYQLGYAYYKQQDYGSAINEFNKIIDGTYAVAQNAFYHLAYSYLQVDQKQQALNAFKNASEMDFDATIQEDAWLNYAKLSYQIGNSFQSTPEVIVSFMEAYPKNEQVESLRLLLIDSYITSKNYKEAIELIESNRSFKDDAAYQKVTFYHGLNLYSEGMYTEAIDYFTKSLKNPIDATITARAQFWGAECHYLMQNFNESLEGYQRFSSNPNATACPEYESLLYNLGYNYFKLKKYPEAITHFNNYVDKTKTESLQKADAYVRLGDSYFVTSTYWPALESYNKALELGTVDKDYAHFQKSISYGFVDRIPQKIEGLQGFDTKFPISIYKDDALYELGNTFVSQDQNDEAIASYDKLIKTIPASSFVAKALLKKALIYDNTGKSDKALTLFKRVANDFPSSEEAIQAVASAKIIYIDQGKVDQYAEWVNRLDYINLDTAEIDDASYKAAEQVYLENNSAQALIRFNEYLEEFPNGKHALKSNFYVAQLYYADTNKEASIPHYTFVVNKEPNEFSEQALARLSQIYLEQENYQSALPLLIRLEKEANFPQNIIFAQSNAMKASYELKKYHEAAVFADKVLLNEKIDNTIKSDAQTIIARSSFKMGYESKAKSAYAEVAKIATGKLAAEAMYYDAYFKNKSQLFEASNKSIQVLAKEYASYKYFGAKGLVLMAQNFYALEDAFQATYILESVITNFNDYPEVVEEATTLLAAIKKEEAKTNDSIEIEEEN